MNRKQILGLLIAVVLFVPAALFAGNERGIDLYRAEFYDAAKYSLLEQKNLSPEEQAENYYYLGQIYYKQNSDSAAHYFSRAISADDNYPLGYVGEGTIALSKGDAKGAETLFKRAGDIAKKDPSVQVAIAEAYFNADKMPEVNEALKKAKKIDKKYAGTFLVEGDIFKKQDKLGDAAGRYQDAIAADPNEKLAYLRLGKLYEYVNPKYALDFLDKLIQVDPEYIPAYALIGDINRNQGTYLQALRAYEKIINIPGLPLVQHERYAQLLYFTDQYEKSLQEINYVLSQDPDNVVMHRLRAYNSFKLEDYEQGVQQMEEFLSKAPVDQHIYLDYITYGRLLLKVKRQEDALAAFQKAANLDSSKSEIFKEMATAYESMKNYPEAIKQYEKYFEIEPNATILDYHYYGVANYNAASRFFTPEYTGTPRTPEQQQQDDAEFQVYLEQGNKAFDKVIELRPESYLGYLFKGYLNAFLDVIAQSDETAVAGAAIPYYDKALEIMLAGNEDGKRNKEILDVYRYFASYYYVQKDYPKALEYFRKILEMQPNNEDVKQTIEAIEKM
ncbi:MAG: tetratricopeptide repeat protein [Bacteroidales bacterium]|nr:tetratricopeptide repeat protein [Bacteroidales bacterium]